ncbi:AIPR family protein [Bosea sp. 2KB_26]|uniref:AIPR family protein n=1 Tax=Bosea sp. 2KB_26 TaxID=3237475 RepID=UPI003F92EA36
MDGNSVKYDILIKILDAIRGESVGTKWEKKYSYENNSNSELIQNARSRAFVHLFLKVMFGIVDFSEREPLVTDGSHDGGVDGYFIDRSNRQIYLIQSKLRSTNFNFKNKNIDLEEILSMDIERITGGITNDSDGNNYNGKIQGLIRAISEISDIARWNYKIIILANCSISNENLLKLTGGFRADTFDFNRSYNELVFPVVSGNYFKAQDVMINIDLSNKSAGAKTSYSVETPAYECEITVLFVPTLEIAQIMDKYRNAVLEYNPRSYLDLIGQSVHSSIRETLLRPDSNEFALMNNGITILSDETNINERIGQKNKAQLMLLNPQIINGGQTAYTLSRIYAEDKPSAAGKFAGKEVLTKIITLTPKDSNKDSSEQRLKLIEEISAASNRQTPVINADRFSNESVYVEMQRILYKNHGIFFERKRGEFSDGIKAGYISESDVIERNLYFRLFLCALGDLRTARKKRVFMDHKLNHDILTNEENLAKSVSAFHIFKMLDPPRNTHSSKSHRNMILKLYIGLNLAKNEPSPTDILNTINQKWGEFLIKFAKSKSIVLNKNLGKIAIDRFIGTNAVEDDLTAYVRTGEVPSAPPRENGRRWGRKDTLDSAESAASEAEPA